MIKTIILVLDLSLNYRPNCLSCQRLHVGYCQFLSQIAGSQITGCPFFFAHIYIAKPNERQTADPWHVEVARMHEYSDWNVAWYKAWQLLRRLKKRLVNVDLVRSTVTRAMLALHMFHFCHEIVQDFLVSFDLLHFFRICSKQRKEYVLNKEKVFQRYFIFVKRNISYRNPAVGRYVFKEQT